MWFSLRRQLEMKAVRVGPISRGVLYGRTVCGAIVDAEIVTEHGPARGKVAVRRCAARVLV